MCYKVYAMLLKIRGRKSLDIRQPPSQARFRMGRSVDLYLLALTIFLERIHEYNTQLLAISMDLSKVFDRTN